MTSTMTGMTAFTLIQETFSLPIREEILSWNKVFAVITVIFPLFQANPGRVNPGPF